MSDTIADNRRRLHQILKNVYRAILLPEQIDALTEAYLDLRRHHSNPECFDERMNLFLRSACDFLLEETDDADRRILQVQTIKANLEMLDEHNTATQQQTQSTRH